MNHTSRSEPTNESRIERAEHYLGPAFIELPWCDENVARSAATTSTSTSLLGRLSTFEHRLRDSWRCEEPWREVVEAFAHLFPEDVACVFSAFADGATFWAMSYQDAPRLGFPPVASMAAARQFGRYRGQIPAFSNRPASLCALMSMESTLEGALEDFSAIYPNADIGNQLRSVLIERSGDGTPRKMAWAGLSRRGRRGFSLEENHALFALQPALRVWLRHAEVLGIAPVGAPGFSVAALDAFDAPAVVLHGNAIVHANASARQTDIPMDVRSLGRLAVSRQVFDSREGRTYELMVLPLPLRSTTVRAIASLPPSLRQIAKLLAEGLSDKEIAERTGRPLTSVRTYVGRTFRKLGVTSRRELMLLGGPRGG